MRPAIYAKSALTTKQMDVKLKLGCDGIEVQLLNELIQDREVGDYYNPYKVFDLNDSLKDYPVKVVHAPIISKAGDVTLEILCDDKDIQLLNAVFKIANHYGKLQNTSVIVVLHSESYYDKLSDLGDTWRRINLTVDRMLAQYPYTELVIENVSPLRGVDINGLHLNNNFAFDNVKMVETLREELGTTRIGTCLDTCHAMITNKFMPLIYSYLEEIPVPDYSLDKYFERNAPYLKLIHLADMKGNGYGKGRHGIPFNLGTRTTLNNILDLYSRYKCTCPITLEVEETDFNVCDGYRMTKELVDDYYTRPYPTVEQLNWCRCNCPEAYKTYTDIDLWNVMRRTYALYHTC